MITLHTYNRSTNMNCLIYTSHYYYYYYYYYYLKVVGSSYL